MITPWDDLFISWTLSSLSILFCWFHAAAASTSTSFNLHTHFFFFPLCSSEEEEEEEEKQDTKKNSMSELWSSSASPKFSSLLLYFSYFIFFYPYLLKLISFLSPLFITTSLLFLTFVFSPQFSPHSINFIFLSYQSYSKDQEEEEEEEEDLEAFRVIFGASNFYDLIALPQDEERVVQVVTVDTNVKPAFEKQDMLKLESSFTTKELDKLVVIEKVEEDIKERETESETSPPPISKVKAISQRFEAKLGNNCGVGGEFSPSSRTLSNLGSCGSIRRDKEWKRTLACKLFEERHNYSAAQGNDVSRKGEGMDLLWETYETKYSNKTTSKKNTCRPNVKEEVDDDDDEEEDGGGELCCLQALKFSGGKMNLGMKKPSLVKISKAIKGIRWLHHLTGKKGTPLKA